MAKNKLTMELVVRRVGWQGVMLKNVELSEDTEWEVEPEPYPIREGMKAVLIARAKTEGKSAMVSFQVSGEAGTAKIIAGNSGHGCAAEIQCSGLRVERDNNKSDASRIVITIDC